MYDKINYLKLLKLDQELKQSNQSLYNFDKRKFLELLSQQVIIENEIFYQNKFQFILLIKNLLAGRIKTEEFIKEFFYLNRKIQNLHEAFKIDFKKLDNFEPDPKSAGFSRLISNIFFYCEEFDSDDLDSEYENNIKLFKDSINTIFLEIQSTYN